MMPLDSMDRLAEEWEEQSKQRVGSKVDHRRVMGLSPYVEIPGQAQDGNDMALKRAAVMRFINPIDLHSSLRDASASSGTLLRRLARLVSLIPPIRQATALRARYNAWQVLTQSMRYFTAQREDHATILCSLLLSAGFEAYVILGCGTVVRFCVVFLLTSTTSWMLMLRRYPFDFQERDVAFVLVKDTMAGSDGRSGYPFREDLLCNPKTGRLWSVNDQPQEMFDAGCAFNNRNAYANVQAKVRKSNNIIKC